MLQNALNDLTGDGRGRCCSLRHSTPETKVQNASVAVADNVCQAIINTRVLHGVNDMAGDICQAVPPR